MPEMHLETREKGLKGGGAFIWFCCVLCKNQENGRKIFCCLDQKKTENEKGLFKQIKDIYLSFFFFKNQHFTETKRLKDKKNFV